MIKHILHYVDIWSLDCSKSVTVPHGKVIYTKWLRGQDYGLKATFVCYDGYLLRGYDYYICVSSSLLRGSHWIGVDKPPYCISMLYAKIDLVLFYSQNQVKTFKNGKKYEL